MSQKTTTQKTTIPHFSKSFATLFESTLLHAAITGARKRGGFEKALGAVKVIKVQILYRSQSLLNLARDYFRQQTALLFGQVSIRS